MLGYSCPSPGLLQARGYPLSPLYLSISSKLCRHVLIPVTFGAFSPSTPQFIAKLIKSKTWEREIEFASHSRIWFRAKKEAIAAKRRWAISGVWWMIFFFSISKWPYIYSVSHPPLCWDWWGVGGGAPLGPDAASNKSVWWAGEACAPGQLADWLAGWACSLTHGVWVDTVGSVVTSACQLDWMGAVHWH